MKKLLFTTMFLLISASNLSFTMQPEEQEARCCGWLTYFCTPQQSNNYLPLSTSKTISPTITTPMQAYSNTILEQTAAIKKSQNYHELADLIATVYDARESNNIQAFELGKFIFQQRNTEKYANLASLIVLRIDNYLQTIKETNTPQLTRAQVNINHQTNTSTGETLQNSIHLLNILGINQQKQEVNPTTQLGMDISILIYNMYGLHAEAIYDNKDTTTTTTTTAEEVQ